MKQRIRHLIYFILLVLLDQGTKYLVRANFEWSDSIPIIPDVLVLQYHQNTGAVWGILSGKVNFLAIITPIIFLFILYLYMKIPKDKKYNILKIISVLIMAGAVGNLIDRIFLSYVVDFIYFKLINFPIFNVADCYVTVSCILLFLLMVFYYKDEDLEFIDHLAPWKKKTNDKTEE